MKVTVVSKELIVPSSPTPSHHKTYKFSCIDQQIPAYYIPLILYYSYDESTTITQSKMVIKLKTSLSKTLTNFYPLAGRLTKDQNSVDCNDQGVHFLVARVDSNLTDIIKSPVIEELNQLVVVESYIEEQLAIQVTLFDCGGIAVGVSISHRIADACSFSSFVTHWFTVAKGSQVPLMGPVLDTGALLPPIKESYIFMRNPEGSTVQVPLKKLVTKRFVFSSLAINKLKSQVVDHSTLLNPSRVEVVTALIWKCGTVALGDCKASVAFHSVNFRRKIVPSLQDHQFGNLFQLANAGIAHQNTDVASRVVKLRDSFEKIDSEYLKSLTGKNGAEIAEGNFKEIRKFLIQEGVGVFKFGSWCRLSLHEGDFGWGKPVWVSSANFSDENSIVLMDSRCDDGIEAWVVMNEDNMQKFEQNDELQEFVGSTTS